MSHGSIRGGLALVAGALFLAACDVESPTSPEADQAIATPSLAVASKGAPGVTLPRATVSTAPARVTGRVIKVKSGGNLQAAIDEAKPGDAIELQAGATYRGNFTLRKKSGTGWVTIRSSAHTRLPAPGTRVSPANASLMPKIVSPNGSAAIRTAAGAARYRIVGVEITTATTGTSALQLVSLGSGSRSSQSTLASVPGDIVIERSYIHGRSNLHLKNCVELQSARTAIVDSHLSECHSKIQESHAIIGWNGPGPFLIENNYIAGAGINVMFGGADPASEQLMPADITIRRNHITKPLSWKGKWMTKNLLELKVGRRVLVEGNVMENNWADAQAGFALLFKTAVGSHASSWGRTEDVTVRYNVIRNVVGGVNLASRQSSRGLASRRYHFAHNVMDDVGESNGTTMGRIFQVLDDVDDVRIEHNTAIHSSTGGRMLVTFSRGGNDGFVFRDNIATRGTYGVKGDGTSEGKNALDRMAPRHVFEGNVIAGAKASAYPAGNHFPSALSKVGFVSTSGGDYRLSSSSPYKGKASDGTDPGADVAAVRALTAGVVR